MESDRVTIRIPAALRAACVARAKAAGLSLGEWLRGLAEKETGVAADPQRGMAGASKAAKKRAAKARWA